MTLYDRVFIFIVIERVLKLSFVLAANLSLFFLLGDLERNRSLPVLQVMGSST